MNYAEMKKIMEQYDSIVIYRHVRADFDAYGSQLGLKHLIQLNYPDKQVYACGKDWIDCPDFLEKMENPKEDILKDSLAVICDCSTTDRIDGDYTKCKAVMKIDHHMSAENFGDWRFVDGKATATCYIIACMAKETGMAMDSETASYLFAGLLTDTQKLSVNSVTGKDFMIAGWLADFGIDINKIHRYCFSKSMDVFQAEKYISEKFHFYENKAYAVLTNEDYKACGLTMMQAKDKIDLVREVQGVECWMLAYQKDNGLYNISLRSHQIPIVQIANQYGGGGHLCASGISDLTLQQVNEVIELLKEVN